MVINSGSYKVDIQNVTEILDKLISSLSILSYGYSKVLFVIYFKQNTIHKEININFSLLVVSLHLVRLVYTTASLKDYSLLE